MATPSRTADSPLSDSTAIGTVRRSVVLDRLKTEPWSFNFFQAIRLMARIYRDRAMVGRFQPPSREFLRFQIHQHTSFPASQIQGMTWPDNGTPRMLVNFIGLTGPAGLLPLYYSELIRERARARDYAFAAFLDIFNHRIISLFYQAWEKYRFIIAYERGERDRISHLLLDVIGLGTPGLQKRLPVTDDALLYYSGLLSLHPRSAVGLEQLLGDYFDVPVTVEQFVGAWYPLATSDQCCFLFQNSYSEQVSFGAIVGDEIYDQNSGIRVVLGPLSLPQYRMFLPGGTAHEEVQALTRLYAGPEMDFEIKLILKRAEVPVCELNEIVPVSPQLGWTTWAKTVPMGRDPGDTILRI